MAKIKAISGDINKYSVGLTPKFIQNLILAENQIFQQVSLIFPDIAKIYYSNHLPVHNTWNPVYQIHV